MIRDILERISMKGLNRFFVDIQGEARHIVRAAVREAYVYMVKSLASIMLLVLAILFFVLGGIFFLIEYAHLSKTIALLIGGIIMLFISLMLKINR